MATEIQQFFRDHGISEVEAIIPDMAGIARGKIMPAEKFAEDEGMRLPESIFLQTVTGDYPPDTTEAMSPGRDRYRAASRSEDGAGRALGGRAHRAGDPRLFLLGRPARDDGATASVAARAGTVCAARLGGGGCTGTRVLPDRAEHRRRLSAEAAGGPLGPLGVWRQSYSIAAVNEFDPLFDDIYAFCEAQDIEIDTLIHEDGPAQMEINLLHGAAAGSGRSGLPVQAHRA